MEGSVEHRFVTEDGFSELERAGFFLEVVRPFGLPYRYGLPRVDPPPTGRVPAIMVRAPLMPLVVRHFPDHVVYQIEDAYERVRERLVERGRPSPELGTRLSRYEEERAAGRSVAARVFLNTSSIEKVLGAVAHAIAHDFAADGKEDACAC